MKNAVRIICLALVSVLFTLNIYSYAADYAVFEIDFTKDSDALELISESSDVNCWINNKALNIETVCKEGQSTTSPYVVLDVDIPEAQNARYVKIVLKNSSGSPKIRFGFGDGEITGESCTLLDISSESSKYKTYIFDMASLNEETLPLSAIFGLCDGTVSESVWNGSVTKLYINPFFTDFPGDGIELGLKTEILYIGFFETEAKAKARTVTVPVTDDKTKSVVTILVILIILVLVIAFLKYSSGNSKKRAKTKKKGKK